MPKRINRALELLESGQPVYYTGTRELTYENGMSMSKTWADYINVDMEHGPFDPKGLGEFMTGLVDGGPTASGHRTPTVLCTLPTDGSSAEVVRANAWQMQQVLARGVHGILLCHAENAGAATALVEACRYPFNTIGIGQGLSDGRRGGGGQASAAEIWGVPVDEYLHKADAYPLNPDGELLLGLKIENRRALVHCEASTRVPGLSFAEWGPGDMGMAFGYIDRHDPPYPPEMEAARSRIKAACDNAGLFFLNAASPDTIVELIDEGVKIVATGKGGEEVAIRGRAHTNRQMPV
jgi:4-hydroxy-2-oxoheptanedioate aldolase